MASNLETSIWSKEYRDHLRKNIVIQHLPAVRKGGNKGRLFVDMDGTLAEWQSPVASSEEQLYRILKSRGYFRNLRPHTNVVEAVRKLCLKTDIPVFIASCYIPGCPALQDKKEWLDEYLPELPVRNRIFIPCGSKKEEHVPGGIRENDVLLDDYTKNLKEWSGIGVKLINPVNHSHGSWKGCSVGYKASVEEITEALIKILS